MPAFAVEFRAGEGGRDAEDFCRQLRSAILSFARHNDDCAELVPEQPGSRTLVLRINGSREPYEALSGVHRVQRIPKNDRRGRRHTSTATVAVVDYRCAPTVELRDEEIEIQVYKGPGPGGQHHNKNATAVRLLHRPTGLVVTVERGRSQLQNLREAKAVLIQRLTDADRRRTVGRQADDRRRQISSGERPVKQFTHNVQRQAVIAHATNTVWKMSVFYRGQIGEKLQPAS
jgi:protein subunit release factor A